MHRILYTSEAVRPPTQEDLAGILRVARRRNALEHLTGLLLDYPASPVRPAGFVQVIEGPRQHLEAAYARISRDPRHRNLRLLSSRPVQTRAFGDWSMGRQHVTRDQMMTALPGFRRGDPDAVRIGDLFADPAVAETLLLLYVA